MLNEKQGEFSEGKMSSLSFRRHHVCERPLFQVDSVSLTRVEDRLSYAMATTLPAEQNTQHN